MIAPVIEVARSPHNRHRDLGIENPLVRSLDLIDALLKSGERQTKENLIGQVCPPPSGLLAGRPR